MLKNIIHFLKYHNFFTLAVVVVLVGGSSAFAASPELRAVADSALIGKTEVVVSVDNTALLSADFDNFNPELVITAVSEDADSYYISYTFNTFAVSAGAWRAASKEGELVVHKDSVKSGAGADLRDYVEEELKEIARAEIAFLKEAQEVERKKGETQTTIAVAYTGLLGLVVDPKEKEVEIKPADAPVIQPTNDPEDSASADGAGNPQPTMEANGDTDAPVEEGLTSEEDAELGEANGESSDLGEQAQTADETSVLSTPEQATTTSEVLTDELETTPETNTEADTDLEAMLPSENETASSTPDASEPINDSQDESSDEPTTEQDVVADPVVEETPTPTETETATTTPA